MCPVASYCLVQDMPSLSSLLLGFPPGQSCAALPEPPSIAPMLYPHTSLCTPATMKIPSPSQPSPHMHSRGGGLQAPGLGMAHTRFIAIQLEPGPDRAAIPVFRHVKNGKAPLPAPHSTTLAVKKGKERLRMEYSCQRAPHSAPNPLLCPPDSNGTVQAKVWSERATAPQSGSTSAICG